MIQLRDYQQDLIDKARIAMTKTRHIILQLIQGGGKSVVLSFMCANAVARGNTVLILSHRREITGQNGNVVKALGIDMQYIDPKTKKLRPCKCYVSMAQTLAKRLTGEERDEYKRMVQSCSLILIDECHLQYSDYIFDYVSDTAYVVGLTGTVCRSGSQKQLAEIYGDIVKGVTAAKLIEEGYIVRSRCFTFQAPNLDDAIWNYSTGDWDKKSIARKFAKKERYAGVLKEWFRICPHTKTLVFTTSAEHCISLCQEFCDAGVSAKYLLSDAHPETDAIYSGERDEVLKQFEEGDVEVLVNIDMLGVGYNYPPLQTVVLDMATASYANFSQKAGRGGRSYGDKKYYFLLDFGGNIDRHGKPEADKEYSLWHETSKGGGVMQTKLCDPDKTDIYKHHGCGRLIPISARDCPFCGFHFATQREIYEVELTEVLDDYKGGEMTCPQFIASRIKMGWGNERILMAICSKYSDNPKAAFMEAIPYLRTTDGRPLQKSYWHFFKRNIWDNAKRKKS